jgi:hypothetical protein
MIFPFGMSNDETKELTERVVEILKQKWDLRDGQVVPDSEDIKLAGGGVKFEVLCFMQTSNLPQIAPAETVAKIVQAYLHLMCRLISIQDGDITSFDGDRVMAPNLAAKLSELREDPYRSFITEDVYKIMLDEAKLGANGQPMWEKRTFQFVENQYVVYRSSWIWKP